MKIKEVTITDVESSSLKLWAFCLDSEEVTTRGVVSFLRWAKTTLNSEAFMLEWSRFKGLTTCYVVTTGTRLRTSLLKFMKVTLLGVLRIWNGALGFFEA